MIPDDLSIPVFLRRSPEDVRPGITRRARDRKIPYPKDGFKCKGKRAGFRERHRLHLQRRAEKMRQR